MCFIALALSIFILNPVQAASRQTHIEAQKPIFSRTSKLLTVDEHPFDLAGLTPSVVLYGHLGHLIAGRQMWDKLLAESKDSLVQDRVLNRELNELPADLTELQRLSLTPVTHLTEDELSLLRSSFGPVNPVDAYFSKLYGNYISLWVVFLILILTTIRFIESSESQSQSI